MLMERPYINKQNAAQLGEAEILVRLFNDAIEQGHAENSPALLQRLAQRWSPPGESRRTFGAPDIAAVFAAWKEARRQWELLPVGGTLDLTWPSQPVRFRRKLPAGLRARTASRSLVRRGRRH